MSIQLQTPESNTQTLKSKVRHGHRRTTSSSGYDFNCVLNASEPKIENDMMESSKPSNEDATKKAVNAANLTQKEKQFIVENLDEIPVSQTIVPRNKVGSPINYVRKRNLSIGGPTLSSCPVRKIELKSDYINSLTGLNTIFERRHSVESGCEDGKSDQKSLSSQGTHTRTNSLGSAIFPDKRSQLCGLTISPKHSPQNSITLNMLQQDSPIKTNVTQSLIFQGVANNPSPTSPQKPQKTTPDHQPSHKRTVSYNTPSSTFLKSNYTLTPVQQQPLHSPYRIEEKRPSTTTNIKKKSFGFPGIKDVSKSSTPTGTSSKPIVFEPINKNSGNHHSLTDLHGKNAPAKSNQQPQQISPKVVEKTSGQVPKPSKFFLSDTAKILNERNLCER